MSSPTNSSGGVEESGLQIIHFIPVRESVSSVAMLGIYAHNCAFILNCILCLSHRKKNCEKDDGNTVRQWVLILNHLR